MKGMPFPFDFEGVLFENNNNKSSYSSPSSYFSEPTSVLDSAKFPTSSSTLSSPLNHAAGGKWHHHHDSTTTATSSDLLLPPPSSFSAADDWDPITISDSSPSHEQHSLLRWIMSGAGTDSAAAAGGTGDFDFGGVVEQGFDQFPNFIPNPTNPNFPIRSGVQTPSIFNPLIPQTQTQTPPPSFFGYHDHQSLFTPPPQPKRHNPGIQSQFTDTGQLLSNSFQQQQQFQQQGIIDQLYKTAELVQTGNPALAQAILARLNQQLSPLGKPFYRAAFYFKESLQSLIQTSTTTTTANAPVSAPAPFNLIFRIAAYKSYSEISPLVQFANFTCNQALLDALEGYERIHIVDFDIGYGGQWASLMQELALKSGSGSQTPSLKITALASPSTHDQLELGLTRENLVQFANEINVPFEFEVMSIDSLNSCSWSVPFHASENEAVAVNLPVGCLSSYQVSVPLVLRFVKQMSPRIVVSVDRGCDRTDLPFANHVIHALQSYSNLLESLDAVNVNMDALHKIERFLLQPGIEKIIMGRFRSGEKTQQHWRTLFISAGFSPVSFSNFAESQAECILKRTPVRGFQVEKRQSSLVLCWQRKELISASAWRCC